MYEEEIYFLGNRTYVQATSIIKYVLLNFQLEHGVTSLSNIYIKRYKQIQEVQGPLKILSCDLPFSKSSLRGTISIELGATILAYNILEVGGEISRCPDITYRQQNYAEQGENAANIILKSASDFWEILYETVQLTKIFHINKYNLGMQIGFRFLVGGFEKLRGFEPKENELFKITSRIINHSIFRDKLYNQILIDIKSDLRKNSFLMQFIGKQEK